MEPFYKNEYRNQLEDLFEISGEKDMDNKKALELLLLFTLPIHEAGPVAERLIKRFGSFSSVIGADFESLISVGGMDRDSAVLINLVNNLTVRARTEQEDEIKTLKNHEASRNFFFPLLGLNRRECIYCALTDEKLNVISCEALNEESLRTGEEELEKCVSLAEEKGAFSVIIGYKTGEKDITPSEKILAFVTSLKERLNEKNILLNDVIVTGRDSSLAFSNELSLAIYL